MEKDKVRIAKVRLDKLVGMNIRRERELRKITREELAEILDLKVAHVGLIERGMRGATAVTLTKLAKVFNISMDNFFEEHNRAISAFGKYENEPGSYHKKVTALMAILTEAELKVLAQTVKGLTAMRKANN